MNGVPASYGARIAGVGHYVPDRVMANADFESFLETSDEWIVTRTGMRERRYAAEDQASSDLAARAAKHALERAKLDPDEIDCIIVATVTPDYQFPATACLVQSKLGLAGKAAFDIEIACSGFIYALPMAASFVRAGVFRRVLIIGVEVLSRVLNMKDRSTAILFGDGAGAAIIERTSLEDNCFIGCELGSDGDHPELLYIEGGGSRSPLTAEGIAEGKQFVQMSGREIFKNAVNRMVETAGLVLERAHMTVDDVKWLVPHQANRRIIDAVAKRLQIPGERVVVNIEKYGNTSSASIPIALSEFIDKGALAHGDLILFSGFGGGLSWGSVAWKWAA